MKSPRRMLAGLGLLSVVGLTLPTSADAATVDRALPCPHPRFVNRSNFSAEFIPQADHIGIRSGVDLSCPLNGYGEGWDHVWVWCKYRNRQATWYFVDRGFDYDLTGWVPSSWIDSPVPADC